MTTEVTAVSQVTEADRIQREEFLREFLAEEFPSIDASPGGVLYARVLQPNALLSAIDAISFERLRSSQSLLLVEQDPTLADDDTVDNILSNYFVTRQTGTKATGQVAIVLASKITTVLSAGAQFLFNDLAFNLNQSFTGVTDANLKLSSTDRLIQARPDGTYSFLVDVEAADVGDSYRLKQDSELTLDSPPPSFVRAYANQDFQGGASEQTNQDLIGQMASGVSTKVSAGRGNIEALILESYPRVQHMSIVGFGDAEMTRDRDNIFASSHGGKGDIYLASETRPLIEVFVMTATCVDPATQTMQIVIGKDVKPGFYTVWKVLRSGDTSMGTLEITSLARDIDTTGGGFIPRMPSAFYGAFSRYQTAVLRFVDPSFVGAINETADYDVSILGLPSIADVQALMIGRSVHNPVADHLVRAAVPMIAGITITIDKLASELSDPAALTTLETNIKNEVANRVNALGFALGKLPANIVTAAAASQLSGNASVRAPVELTATLFRPDGVVQPFFSTSEIIIPYDPMGGVSQRTAMFFLSPDDVLVHFNDVSVLEV